MSGDQRVPFDFSNIFGNVAGKETTLEYMVVSGNQQWVVQEVNRWLAEGWELQGGVSSHNGNMVQAMVKEIPE